MRTQTIHLHETRRIVLLVDDRPEIEPLLWDWLGSRGVAVLRAASTQRALELLDQARVDAVISDLARREGDVLNPKAGMQLALQIRKSGSPVPICIFTFDKAPGVQTLAVEAGANYVTEQTSALIKWLEQLGL